MRVTLSVCDVCQQHDRPTKPYRIVADGQTLNAELCAEHAEPVQVLVETVLKNRPKVRPRKQTRVVTLDEIEAMKDQSKK